MKEIHVEQIVEAVEALCIRSNIHLNSDVRAAIDHASVCEASKTGQSVLQSLARNADIAEEQGLAICQDTGMAIVFVKIGQSVHVIGGSLTAAIEEGVRRGYRKGYFRNSIVGDPLLRVNTNDNTPPVIHYDIVEGEGLIIEVAPKGFGSENMSGLKMLKPSDGVEGVKSFVIETVSKAGANPCPPVVVGVGIGGSMEKCALLAKEALLRPIGRRSTQEHIGKLEEELLESINRLGIGPAGLGGRTTALDVHIETWPTHIAGLPVAVNISCHVLRHARVEL